MKLSIRYGIAGHKCNEEGCCNWAVITSTPEEEQIKERYCFECMERHLEEFMSSEIKHKLHEIDVSYSVFKSEARRRQTLFNETGKKENGDELMAHLREFEESRIKAQFKIKKK